MDTKQENKILRWLWPVLLAVQVVFLLVMAFRLGQTALDNDCCKLYTHMMAIWERGTLLIPNWRYITTLEFDCALLFALPFYGLTKNAFLAFSCANVVIILGWTALVPALCGRLGLKRPAACLATLLTLLPYGFSGLSYWNMMFLHGAQYVVKAALPLLLLYLLLKPKEEKVKPADWVLPVVYLAGVALSSFSSGFYVAASGLAPVLAAFGWQWLQEKRSLNLYNGLCAGGSIVAALGGILACNALGLTNKGSNMLLVNGGSFAVNAQNCLTAIFRLFGALERPKNQIAAVSPEGLSALLRFAFVCLLLGALAVTLAKKGRISAKGTSNDGAGILACMFCWNTVLLMLTETQYGDEFSLRYHIIGTVPLLLLAVLCLDGNPPKGTKRMRYALTGGLVGGLCLLMLLCNLQSTLAAGPDNEEELSKEKALKMAEVVDALGNREVLVVSDYGLAEMASLWDTDHRYAAYNAADNLVETYDGDVTMNDAAYFADVEALTLIVPCRLNVSEELPTYFVDNFTYMSTDYDYNVFVSVRPPLLDGPTGLPDCEYSVDYCDSEGYRFEGTVNGDRQLWTDAAGGVVVESGSLALKRDADITLSYTQAKGGQTVGEWQIWQKRTDKETAALDATETADGEDVLKSTHRLLDSAALTSDAAEAKLQNIPAGSGYVLRVEMAPGCTAALGQIVYSEAK